MPVTDSERIIFIGGLLRALLGTLLLPLLISSCANPINQKTASNYYGWGLEAELQGNYVLAERNYERALINARLGHSPDAGVSASMYNLGRMKGYLCKFTEAESLLLEALKLQENVSGADPTIMTKRLFELARFYSDRGLYRESVPYFARGIPEVKRLGIEASDPMALADALDEFANAAKKSGNSGHADKLKIEAEALRSANIGKIANYIPIRYGQGCHK